MINYFEAAEKTLRARGLLETALLGHLRRADGGQFALVRLLYPEQERTQRRRYHGIGGGYRLHFGITRRRANV